MTAKTTLISITIKVEKREEIITDGVDIRQIETIMDSLGKKVSGKGCKL